MPGRLSEKRETEILEAYEAWDSDETTVDELCADLGIPRQTLYLVLNRHGIKPKSQRRGTPVPDDLLDRMADKALETLLSELVELRNTVATLEAENAKLRSRRR